MYSGRETLGSIDDALQQQRANTQSIEAQIEKIRSDLEQLQADSIKDFRELAQIRLGAISGGTIAQQLDEVEQRALAMLKKRASTEASLNQQLAEIQARLTSLADARKARAEAMDEAARAVDEAEAATQARLEQDTEYKARADQAREAERMAAHADEKASQSEQEKEQKGDSYHHDPLFMYLWNRHYGLPSYKASGLIRWLDGKVARLIGFADARANYARLLEIPVRLREHAEGLKAEAEAEAQSLQELDRKARQDDGIAKLDDALSAAQEQLDAIDQEIRDAETQQQDLFTRKSQLTSGEDADTREAIDFLANAYGRGDLMQLLHEALATPMPEDDVIVGRTIRREQDRQRLEGTRAQLKETLAQHGRRLAELRSIRDEFKRNRYDGRDNSFLDGALISVLLSEFLRGALGRDGLWDEIRRQRRRSPTRSRPDFGSGRLGRGGPWGGGTWSGGSWGGGSSGGGFGGGGFGTGGGFGGGGGGFRTGGGF
jgi:hypothetical protein